MMREGVLLALGFALTLTLGCTTPLAPVGDFGTATALATNLMIANPGASMRNTEQPDGLPGLSATNVLENYDYTEETKIQIGRSVRQKESAPVEF